MEENQSNEQSGSSETAISESPASPLMSDPEIQSMPDSTVQYLIDDITGNPKSGYWNKDDPHHERYKAIVEAMYQRLYRDADAGTEGMTEQDAAMERHLRETVGITDGDIEASKDKIEEDLYNRELARLGDTLRQEFGGETKTILTNARDGIKRLTKEQRAAAEEAGLMSDKNFIKGAHLIEEAIKRTSTHPKKE
jgi:hypothetical protein